MMVEQKHRTKENGCASSVSLEIAFRLQKTFAKLLNDAFYAILLRQIKELSWSDLEPQGRIASLRNTPVM